MQQIEALKLIQQIFRDILDDENLCLSEESSPETVEGWDSIVNVNIIIAVESEFGIKLGIDDIQRVKTVGDILSIINSVQGR